MTVQQTGPEVGAPTEPPDPEPARHAPAHLGGGRALLPPGRDARAALLTTWVVIGYLLFQLVASLTLQVDGSLHGLSRIAGIAVGLLAGGGFLLMQARIVGDEPSPAWHVWLLVAAGPVVLLADGWTVLGLSLATVLLALTGVRAWAAGALLTALTLGELLLQGSDTVAVIAIPAICWLAAAVIAVLTRTAVRMQALRTAREQLARREVDQERHRISRELHDIVGRTLAAVSVRTQTALRLVDRDPEACRLQLEHIAEAAVEGQTQLRRLIRGEVIVGLDSELTTVVDLFARLEIDAEVDAGPVCDDDVQVLAAKVVRESVTNMLKHSRPRHAWISVRDEGLATVVTATNDGSPRVERVSGGTGLAELATQVRATGGTLQAGSVDGGRFRVIARIPHQRDEPEELP